MTFETKKKIILRKYENDVAGKFSTRTLIDGFIKQISYF